jgi:hypothetical protein
LYPLFEAIIAFPDVFENEILPEVSLVSGRLNGS